uniref:Uncharacterized protein n=1 Tax=viral metagenome TaxID=1070528 RepID=A0A6C0ESU7_9ZZZZ
MLSIAEYNPFFIKNSFNLPEHKIKYKKPIVIDYDPLFYAIYNKMNNQDITHIDYSKVNETQEKMKIAEKLDSINYKFKNKDKIMENLMYEKKINMKTFNALCMYYKINVLFVKDNVYLKMFYNDKINDEINYYTMNEHFHFIGNVDVTDKYEIVNIDKPFKSVSSYKLDELKDISRLLHLPCDLKKQLLYDSINNIINKLNIF